MTKNSRAIVAAALAIAATIGFLPADWSHENDCVLVWGSSAVSRVTCESLGATDQAACATRCAQQARRLEATADCVRESDDGSGCPGEARPTWGDDPVFHGR